MRWRSHPPLLWGTAVAAVVLTGSSGVTGCASGSHGGSPGARPLPSSTASPTASGGPAAAPPATIGLSPSGVTTRVDAPADSTEEQYYQACHAAKVWMDAQPTPGQSQFEPYLAMVQSSPAGTPGTWDARWADLTPARQAAVITAARAAANEECG